MIQNIGDHGFLRIKIMGSWKKMILKFRISIFPGSKPVDHRNAWDQNHGSWVFSSWIIKIANRKITWSVKIIFFFDQNQKINKITFSQIMGSRIFTIKNFMGSWTFTIKNFKFAVKLKNKIKLVVRLVMSSR